MENMTNHTHDVSPDEIDEIRDSVKPLGHGLLHRWRNAVQKAQPKKLKNLPKFDETVNPAMARLTDELIEETVGENGVLVREFRELIAGYDPDKNPIGPNEARAILLSMLDLAVSRRKLLNERLERSVEVGNLYQSYYGRVQAVTAMAAQAHTDLERMDMAEEDYRYYHAMLVNVRDTSTVQAVQPKNEYLRKVIDLRTKMNNREKDIMMELEERGGG